MSEETTESEAMGWVVYEDVLEISQHIFMLVCWLEHIFGLHYYWIYLSNSVAQICVPVSVQQGDYDAEINRNNIKFVLKHQKT